MSPALVIAFALAGDAERDLRREPVQRTMDGRDVYIADLMPSPQEVQKYLLKGVCADDFARDFQIASRNPLWLGLQAPEQALFPWSPTSTTLRRPPFAALDQGSLLGRFVAHPLLVVGDDVTTDHLSPASAIPPNSHVADFLVDRGEDRADLNVFASRRGNWEVMLRAAFYSKSLRNLLVPNAPVAHTIHTPSGEMLPIWQAAERYASGGDSVVLVAGERYGTGSSRDWAAKGQRLLGIRAVLALSFERIHRSNLIGMGVTPLCLPEGMGPEVLQLLPGDRIELDLNPDSLAPRSAVPLHILRADGSRQALTACAAIETQLEAELLRAGGVIPSILHKTLAEQRSGSATMQV